MLVCSGFVMIHTAVQLIQIFSAHGSSHGSTGIRGGTRGPRGPKKVFLWYTLEFMHIVQQSTAESALLIGELLLGLANSKEEQVPGGRFQRSHCFIVSDWIEVSLLAFRVG